MYLSDLFSSVGLKRILSTILSAFAGIVLQVVGAGPLLFILQLLGGLLGGVGLVHAKVSGKLGGAFSGFSLTALVQLLVLLTSTIPALKPYASIVQMIASLLGVASLGALSLTRPIKK